MLDELEPRLRGQPAELRMVDIDTDPGLRARYDIDIPVLTVNDIEVCRHRLDHAAIDKILCG
ncbi:MAG: glutaredoxin family protein [Gammaproteobacteria bacterium]|nr:glutaredoxin family protein [Gammaproteobacteria bacterium]